MVELILERGQVGRTDPTSQGHRKLANMLDLVENGVAIGRTNHFAEQATEKLYFLPQPGIFFVLQQGGAPVGCGSVGTI